MPKCMTIADETVDQKDICTEIIPKDVVDFILEEVLLSAFAFSDKGCSRIGDFNITEDFRQDQLPHPKDFEQVDNSQSKENLDSGENVTNSLAKEEKAKSAAEFTVITEEILADNEFQIQNGQIHLEKNKTDENENERDDYLDKEDAIMEEIIEIEYFNGGKLNKIYVPLNPSEGADAGQEKEEKERKEEVEDQGSETAREDPERPFKPFTTEELRQSTLQVWGNGNSSLVGKWDGDVLAQREEAVRLMEELSSVHVFPDSSLDPNRPRACAFAEEDVKKIIKEIEEISFTQCHTNPEDPDVVYHPDGQGDADLESKSFTKTKDNTPKPQKLEKPQEEDSFATLATDELQGPPEEETSSEKLETKEDTISASLTMLESNDSKSSSSIENQSSTLTSAVDDRTILLTGSEIGSEYFSGMMSLDTGRLSWSKVDDRTTADMLLTGSEMGSEYFSVMMSLEAGSPSGSKLDEVTLSSAEFASDVGASQRKQSGPTGVTNSQRNEGTSSLGSLTTAGSDPEYFFEDKDMTLLSEESNLFVDKLEETRKSQDGGNFLQGSDVSVEMVMANDGGSGVTAEGATGETEVGNLGRTAQSVEGRDGESGGSEEPDTKAEDSNATPAQNLENHRGSSSSSNRSLAEVNASKNSDAELPAMTSSQSISKQQFSKESLEEDEAAESSDAGTVKFKLQSERMYLGANYKAAGLSPDDQPQEFSLTKSEEAFIDMSESVIQIINPSEGNAEEESATISFSLLSEVKSHGNIQDMSLEKTDSRENPTKRVYSGMTTIGPIKNLDHDPKDLTAPEIDFGKMTRITSSRQLANDIGLFNPEVTAIKIVEESDSDDFACLSAEDQMEANSLVNRDIASLTKVQKIREVMSYQPKSEEDFEDDEVLARPRLDLKDVESMTDERYKVPDVSIPLLSFEIGEGGVNTENELLESMSLVISGLTNPTYYQEDIEEDQSEAPKETPEESTPQEVPETAPKDTEGEVSVISLEKDSKTDPDGEKEQEESANISQNNSGHKYSTLGSVFKKASSKLIRKDGDLLVRSSKSLPRDASRISTTESIRSMLDDCQSSASNILKKSRSLLKNTQNVFKSISQGRMNQETSTEQKKPPFCPSESDVSTVERKFSGFLKKEDFTKAKNLIKGKVEKALKSIDSGMLGHNQPESSSQKELQVVVRNADNFQVERMENFKKLLPKSPLVYKSQFVKSQVNVQSEDSEEKVEAPGEQKEDGERKKEEEVVSDAVVEDNRDDEQDNKDEQDNRIVYEAAECHEEPDPEQPPFVEKLEWINAEDNTQLPEAEDTEPKQPDYIIMETVQGLPTGSDLESPSSEKENLNLDNIGKIVNEKGGNDLKKTEPSNSFQMFSDGGRDVAPCFQEAEDEKTTNKTATERKNKTKKKKLTARFRSFWCSAFGRVKTPPAKGGDLP